MANSQLKLYYYDAKGRVEAARLILAAAGKEYEDIRFSMEDWPKYKYVAPFGQCPFLDIDGKTFAQSLAIKTYLAREFGFHGQTNLESLKIDQVVQLMEEMGSICAKAMFGGDETEIKEATAKVKADECPRYLGYLEKLLKENGTGYFVGNRLTLADIIVLDVATGMLENIVDINDSFPLLKKNVQTNRAHSKIGPYLVSRHSTPF